MSFSPMGKACLPRWLPIIALTIRMLGGAQAGEKHPAAITFIIILVTYVDLRLTGIIVLLTDMETVRLILIVLYVTDPVLISILSMIFPVNGSNLAIIIIKPVLVLIVLRRNTKIMIAIPPSVK